MTQQEINANRTQGEWTSSKDCLFIRDSEGSVIAVCPNYKDKKNTNAFAIVSAVNNTYGKGINPEAVEEILKALRKAEYWIGAANEDANILTEIRSALNAAKL